jgi:hypothetical protein
MAPRLDEEETNELPIPGHSGHPFRAIPDTDSI